MTGMDGVPLERADQSSPGQVPHELDAPVAGGVGTAPALTPALRRWAAAGTALGVVLVLALVAGLMWLLGPERGQDVATPPQAGAEQSLSQPPTPTVDPSVLRLQALDQLLAARSQAVLARDKAAFMGSVDPASTAFADRQSALFDNLADVPIGEWRYEYAGDGPSLAAERLEALGESAWVARVVLVYRLADADLADVRREQYLTLVDRGGQWLVADDTDGGSSPDLWDLGPVGVVRGERSLVLGTADLAMLKRYARETDDAAQHVDDVWGSEWPRTVVVMVPKSQAEMARLLLRSDEAGLDQIAAVTTGEIGLDKAGTSADRVIANPSGFAQLGDLGRQVVLTHEITHVATRATTTQDVPIWLSEGFADYVAYADTGISRAVIAQDVLDRVRAGQPPTALPQAADFDPARGQIAPAYSGAWLAAELISRRWGQEALVTFYRTVASGTAVDAAFSQVLGTDQAGFEREWLAYLQELAS